MTTTPTSPGGPTQTPTVHRFTATSALIRNIPGPHVHAWITKLHTTFPTAGLQPGLDSVLFTHPDLASMLTDLRRVLHSAPVSADHDLNTQPSTAPQVHTIPVHYSGSDLTDIAEALRLSPEQVITAHTTTRWRVQTIGFAPGFGYLAPDPGNDDTITRDYWAQLPRRATPRHHVPAGSVAVAAGYSAIYPAAMPGGWHLLGTTTITLFDPTQPHPSLLQPGDHVHFAPVEHP